MIVLFELIANLSTQVVAGHAQASNIKEQNLVLRELFCWSNYQP